jgi:cellulose synthase/poly-beta-1,6-N-acetylglucosamine synthase-like glycosyltransferase
LETEAECGIFAYSTHSCYLLVDSLLVPKNTPSLPASPPRSPVMAAAPKRWELLTLRTLALLGLFAMGGFLYWFFQPQHVGYVPLYLLLTFAFFYKLLVLLHEWYHYTGISVPEKPVRSREYSVDMLTSFVPGEPYEMIGNTLRAMKAVSYPHETYLCDEGDDPFLKELCAELGVHHVYRGTDKTNGKAGNLNYALRNHAKGEITIILDPDHVPIPAFIDRVLPFFEDPKIGYVQSVQAYTNRNESFIAKGAAEQTYQFYGPMMMSMNRYGTAQAIGANCAFRREALDSIGGHAAGLAEDMHTAMQLHATGWKSVYTPEILTRGLVPATLSGYYSQQLKWSRGVFELLFFVLPGIFTKLSWRQAIHYLTLPLYFLYGLVSLIDIAVPIAALFLSEAPWQVDVLMFAFLLIPLTTISILIRQFSQRWLLEEHERGFHFIGGTLRSGTWWVFLLGFVYTLLRIKVPYLPTPKGDARSNAWKLSIPNLSVIALSLLAIGYGLYVDWTPYNWVMAVFAGTNVLILSIVVLISQQRMIGGLFDWLYDGKAKSIRKGWYYLRHNLFYLVLRKGLVVGVLAAAAFIGTAIFLNNRPKANLSRLPGPVHAPLGQGRLFPLGDTLAHETPVTAQAIQRSPDGFQWIVEGKAFAVQGISYHSPPEWYSNEVPLTRRQVAADFQAIKAMGANTIRRYHSDVFDHNVLRMAKEYDLKVLYGFALPEALNYGADLKKTAALRETILQTVKGQRGQVAVLGWMLGQETWSRLGHHFQGEELKQVRLAYLTFLDELSQEIHLLDKERPILVALEGGKELSQAIEAHHRLVPDIDVFGVNAFYEEYVLGLDSVMHELAPDRPYLLSEFGPIGYWDREKSPRAINGYLEEPSDYEKARQYQHWWQAYVVEASGQGMGGIAYNWRDIPTGTRTWYGLTDMENRRKASYYALQESWTGVEADFPLADSYLSPADPLWDRRPALRVALLGNNRRKKDIELNWYLSEESPTGPASGFRPLGRGRNLDISEPLPAGPQRIYLYVSDKHGNVSTASQVINPSADVR